MARDVPEPARALAERFWPGPLTLVLPKHESCPTSPTSGLPKVAIRVPAHPVAQALLRAFGGPLAAPSANRFGRISPTDAAAVRAELGDAVPLILDGGPCAVGLESTVLEVDGTAKSRSCARAAFRSRKSSGSPAPVRARHAGGHRARSRPASSSTITRRASRCVCWSRARRFRPVPAQGWLAFGTRRRNSSGVVENLSPGGDLREAAANFFRALRTLDDDPRVEKHLRIPPPEHGLGLAINERLERASAR